MSKIKVNDLRAVGGISSSISMVNGLSASSSVSLTNGSFTTVGVVTSTSLVGNGAALTGLPIATAKKSAALSIAGVLM